MRLRKLILHGFKSFADRTEFLFDQPVTCVVGPNGCGKSNVVDAVKWVLGEQSAKSLRGDAMLDVVFNGSSARKPAGMAEVVLVFDNPIKPDGNRTLNLPADEVAVGRRLYRDGTSEYTINNSVARLKDIRDLFLDTGVGVDAYSVIEQGRVAQLLESNPQQRRLIFEEAAGISRFKVKKKESQRKLEKVDQNLLRVKDIVDEVEKRLRSVKIQAGRARTYQEYLTKLNDLRLGYSLQEFHNLQTQLVALEKDRDETQFRVDDVAGDLAKRQNELAEAREKSDSISNLKQRAEHELIETQGYVRAAQQRQQHADQQLKQIAEQIEHFARDRDASVGRQSEIDQLAAQESHVLKELTSELDARRAEIDQKQQSFKDGQLQLNQLINQIENNKQSILDTMRSLAKVNSRLASIEIEERNIAAQQERQGNRRRDVVTDIESAEGIGAELKTKLDDILSQITGRQSDQEAKRQEAASLGQQIKQFTEQLGQAREHRSALLSRQKVLADLEARREGVSEGVKSILRQREDVYPFVMGMVADVLRVDVEHAHVIEAALNGSDQWLIADTMASIEHAREHLEKLAGRVNFIARDALNGDRDAYAYDWNQHSHGVRLAIDLVRCEPEHRDIAVRLLGKTIVVDDLATAIALRKEGPAGFRYVTRAGDIVEPDGVYRVGPLGASMGLLSRRSELEAIAIQIAEADTRIADLSSQVQTGNVQAKEMEEQINAIRNHVYQLNTQKVEFSSQHQQINDRLNSLRRELPVLERELQNLLDQTGKLKDEGARLTTQKQEMETKQTALQDAIEQFSQEQLALVETVKHLGEELTTCRVSLGQVQEKQLASRQSVERLQSQLIELIQQIDRVARAIEQAASRRGDSEKALQAALHDEEVQNKKVTDLRERVDNLTSELAGVTEQVKTLTGKVESIRGLHGELEQKLHALQLQLGELGVRRETLVARTQEELQIHLPDRYTEACAVEGGYQPGDLDWDAIAGEIKELKEKIQRLGNVNLDAIGELEELEQRSQFYAGQINDLAQAKEQLEQLIDEINRESSVRFEQTFIAVREHFQTLFRKLFGGGSADITLELEVDDIEAMKAYKETAAPGEIIPVMRKTVDPLDAGIEIIARPPGKKPVTITQLSGGEKAMTCIALLMSIFKSKPSPFCILDEVDAPLDEANNQRFTAIVEEFLSMSQFIIITHHKRTMQIGDVLYGVTMQEQGVSKRVAVKFDQVEKDGRLKNIDQETPEPVNA